MQLDWTSMDGEIGDMVSTVGGRIEYQAQTIGLFFERRSDITNSKRSPL